MFFDAGPTMTIDHDRLNGECKLKGFSLDEW